MKKITYEMIKSYGPCYDPAKYIPETWEGTIVDLLKLTKIPFEDRLWVVLRTNLVSERLMRLFAVWSYRQTLKFITNPDPRSIEAANVAERFANNEATAEQLTAAEAAARSDFLSGSTSALYAAKSAAEAALLSIDMSAWYASWSAAKSAASYAAKSAAESTAEPAARYAARIAAKSAAMSAARDAQCEKLIEMIEQENRR